MIDLHVHTTASDGSLTPEEVVRMAANLHLKAIAITDHDTVSGVEAALKESGKFELKVIPGVEFSTFYQKADLSEIEIHVLGYNINYNDPYLLSRLNELTEVRYSRNKKICDTLTELGFPVTMEMLKERFKDSVLTRANFATYMTEKGFTKDKSEAFDKYLSIGRPCYIPKFLISMEEAVKLTKDSGGIPIIAHPTLYKFNDDELSRFFTYGKEIGIRGIEAMYSKNKEGETEKFTALAEENGLFITGGSDFHGDAKPDIQLGTGRGNLCIPDELLNNIGE